MRQKFQLSWAGGHSVETVQCGTILSLFYIDLVAGTIYRVILKWTPQK